MAIRELTSSRNLSYNEGQPTGIREYHCHPYTTESEVIALIGVPNGIPPKMDPWGLPTFDLVGSSLRVFDHTIRRDPNVTRAWIVTVTYRQRGSGATVPSNYRITPNQRGAITRRLDINAQFEDTWRQWASPDELRANTALLDEFQVPRYPQFTAQSDIGGRKIDAAGYPTSVLRHKVRLTIDVVDVKQPDFFPEFLGCRNRKKFAGYDPGTVLFVGCNSVELPNSMFNSSYQFEVDSLFHLKQLPKRQANGYVVLDLPANANDVTATGQAKVVSYVQPHPWCIDLTVINSLFYGIL